jgi:hypothetical protein
MKKSAIRQPHDFFRIFIEQFSHFCTENRNPVTVVGACPQECVFNGIQSCRYSFDK